MPCTARRQRRYSDRAQPNTKAEEAILPAGVDDNGCSAPGIHGGGGDCVDLTAASTAESTTMPQDRKAEIVARMKNERRQSKLAKSESNWWGLFFAVYVKGAISSCTVFRQ